MSAILSEDGKYRYHLSRDFDMDDSGSCCFIMLNPSTADAINDDPTIRRCINFAKRFGCSSLEVVNLFAYRSSSPDVLYGMSRAMAIGPENDEHILSTCNDAKIIICAWGNHGKLHNRGEEIIRMLETKSQGPLPKALKLNQKSQQPAHPLYLRGNQELIELGGKLRGK